MNVSLTPELERLVNSKVESGRYGSASEVVREALRLLAEHDEIRRARIAELRAGLRAGIAQLDAGRARRFDAAAVTRIRSEGRRKLEVLKRRA